MKKTILESIKVAVEAVEWESNTQKNNALDLCMSIYGLYMRDGGDFFSWRRLSSKYFEKIIKTSSSRYIVRTRLLEMGILQNLPTYSVERGKAKPYRFCDSIINSDKWTTYDSKLKNNKEECPFPVEDWLKDLSFKNSVWEWITTYSITPGDIKVDECIEDEYMDVLVPGKEDKARFKKSTAISVARGEGKSLIKFRKTFYIESVRDFIVRKTEEVRKIYSGYIKQIENGSFRIGRNDTNRRLDYNITNMKSELLNHLLYKGEELVELDISNCQFAILGYIGTDLDEDFVNMVSNGRLYQHIAEKVRITKEEAKEYMFRMSFDKIKKEQDIIRGIFPKTMEWVDTFKKVNGYKDFSNLLQNEESKIMIDGLSNRLYNKGYVFFPIHDAFRIPAHSKDAIHREIINYFNEIGFKCNIRMKSQKMALEK